MTNIGYWLPLENPERKLYYILAYPSRAAREASWKDFMADPDWNGGFYDNNPRHYIYAAAGNFGTESPTRIQEMAPTLAAANALYEKRLADAAKGDAKFTWFGFTKSALKPCPYSVTMVKPGRCRPRARGLIPVPVPEPEACPARAAERCVQWP